jgi:hypothetical protein
MRRHITNQRDIMGFFERGGGIRRAAVLHRASLYQRPGGRIGAPCLRQISPTGKILLNTSGKSVA